jgi:hypothetical protein
MFFGCHVDLVLGKLGLQFTKTIHEQRAQTEQAYFLGIGVFGENPI